MENTQIQISTRAIVIGMVLFFSVIAGFFAVWFLRDVIIYLFIALILSLTLEPLVDWFVRKRVPRVLSVLLVMVLFIAGIGGLGSVAIVPLTSQVQSLVKNFPSYISYILALTGVQDASQITNSLVSQFSQTSGSIITATIGVFSGILSLFVALIFTLYIMFDLHNLRIKFVELFPLDLQKEVRNVISAIEVKLGGWLRGQAILMLLIGITTYVGLIILGMPYALALAVIAGMLEVVPVIGPVLGSIPAIIIAFSVDPIMGLGVLFLYFVVQQLENNLIVPKVMQKAVGFNPLVTIIALMIGSKLMGVVGALISIPVTIIIFEIYKAVLKYPWPKRA